MLDEVDHGDEIEIVLVDTREAGLVERSAEDAVGTEFLGDAAGTEFRQLDTVFVIQALAASSISTLATAPCRSFGGSGNCRPDRLKIRLKVARFMARVCSSSR